MIGYTQEYRSFLPRGKILKATMDKYMLEKSITSFQKKDAIAISSSAWNEAVISKPQNIISGFKASGLWPPSLVEMKKRWTLYENNYMSTMSKSGNKLKIPNFMSEN